MTRNKLYICVLSLLLVTLFFSAVTVTSAFAESSDTDKNILITTQTAFQEALSVAQAGDEIIVGDINFSFVMPLGITISKGVIVKSGKTDNAVFSGAAFAVMGGASELDTLNIRFENVTFKGANDTENVNFDGTSVPEGVTAHHAIFFKRHVNADFSGCIFTGYINGIFNQLSYGGAIYGIYSDSESESHRLQLNFEDCSLYNNAGTYGGAIYLSGVDNVFLNMKNCQLYRNVSAFGGAIFADQSNLSFENCTLSDNRFYNFYPQSSTKGGGLYAQNSDLSMKNCSVNGNNAKNGGGIALEYTEAFIDGCIISANKANNDGGALWIENYGNNPVTLINTTLANNTAAINGAFHLVENSPAVGSGGAGKTVLALCTVSGNSPAMNTYSEERFSTFGCAILGENRGEILPDENNAYCHFSQTLHNGNFYSHLNGNKEIPSEKISTVLNGIFANNYGVFCAGDNARDDIIVNVILYDNEKSSFISKYGENIELPNPNEREGYNFDGWFFADGKAFLPEKLYIGCKTTSVDITAKWTFIQPLDPGPGPVIDPTPQDGFPIWATVLIIIGSIAVISAGIVAFLHIRRNKLAAEIESSQSSVPYYNYEEGTLSASDEYSTHHTSLYFSHDNKEQPDVSQSDDEEITEQNAAIPEQSNEHIETAHTERASAIKKAKTTKLTQEDIDLIFERWEQTQLLTPREREVFRLLLMGKQRKEVAAELCITEHTVRDHARNISTKLEVKNKTEMLLKVSNFR